MKIKNLLNKCEEKYLEKDYKELLKLCDEVLKIEPNNQTAIGYKGISYCFLNQPENAVKILEKAAKHFPKNYYLKNNLAIAYYDLGEYEKSLEECEKGLKIKDFDWLYENKIKALLKLERIDEAFECYENAPYYFEIIDLLIETGKYREAFQYCLEEDPDDFNLWIDKIKEKSTSEVGDYYISWIYNIKSKTDPRHCPVCGGELIPIVWGYPNEEMMKKHENGEISLGGCDIPLNCPNRHCKSCNREFDIGCEGLHNDCVDYRLSSYIEYKIRELVTSLRDKSTVVIRSRETLKKEMKSYDDEEFDAFIDHLKKLNYLFEPREGYIKLTGFDDLKCAKEYLDEGKFAAPLWLVYPEFSAWTIGWRMGKGENYAMNMPHHSREFRELFPMPRYWQFNFSKSPYKPHPPIGYFWNCDGKPKYPEISDGVEVNDFITLEDEGEFHSDTFTFQSIEQAILVSKCLHFDKCKKREDSENLKNLKFTHEEERNWDIYKYSVLLNASYFKIMEDENLKQKLLETGDEHLVYISDDEENLFGRALMELRDEIRRLCKNEDKIDWEYTEYLKCKPW